MLTLISMLALVFVFGLENLLLILGAGFFIFLYPWQSAVLISLIVLLKVFGKALGNKLSRFFRRKFKL